MKIWEMPVSVIVWTQEGCPACEEYLPKFLQVADGYKHCLPMIIADVEQYPNAADQLRVESTPLTMIVRFGERSFRYIEGDGPEHMIDSLLQAAVRGMDCQL